MKRRLIMQGALFFFELINELEEVFVFHQI
eukprot:SAG31_NODE_12131_length_965_cov_1.209007_2_plen_29_part_01